MGLLVLAVLLPVGMRPSEATFVAASANPGAQFTAAADFNTVAVVLTDPGSPLRGSVPVTATAASDRGITSVVFSTAPAGTGTWTVACTKNGRALHLHLRHDDGRRRAARRARRRDRQRRLHAHLHGHQPPRRQHRADRDDDRSRLAAHRHRHRRRHRCRRRLRPRRRGPRVQVGHRRVDERSARRRPRRSPAPGTRPRSPTASTTCARSPPTVAGNQTISAPVYNRRVDNTAPTVTITDPGTPLRRHDHARLHHRRRRRQRRQLRQVRVQAGHETTWVTPARRATTPFSCTLQHGHRVADGLYDFRADRHRRRRQGHDLDRGHRAPHRQRRADGRHARRRRPPTCRTRPT